MQQLVMRAGHKNFCDEVNALLLDGWKVVPGTMYVVSLPKVATEHTPPAYVLGGLTFVQVHSVVLENENVR